MMMVVVKFREELIHCWPDAPEEVSMLRYPHRHELHIEVKLEVGHNDRDVEIIMLKRELSKWYKGQDFIPNVSCEMIAVAIRDYLWKRNPSSAVEITVLEDGENGAILK